MFWRRTALLSPRLRRLGCFSFCGFEKENISAEQVEPLGPDDVFFPSVTLRLIIYWLFDIWYPPQINNRPYLSPLLSSPLSLLQHCVQHGYTRLDTDGDGGLWLTESTLSRRLAGRHYRPALEDSKVLGCEKTFWKMSATVKAPNFLHSLLPPRYLP